MALRRAKAPVLLVTNLINIRYITGLSLSAGAMLLTRKGFFLFADDRYIELASQKAPGHISVKQAQEFSPMLKKCRKVAFEAASVTVEEISKWKAKYKSTKFVQSGGVIEEARRAKSAGELIKIKRACSIAKAVLARIPSMLRSGMSEKELAWQIENECRKRGADAMSFETIVGFGANTARPHHHPTDTKFKKGDLVQIDMGCVVDGYMSDFSRVYFTGATTPKQKKVLRALKEAQRKAWSMLRPGITNHQLDAAARKILKSYGFDEHFTHALGHGVGLEIHEGPVLSSRYPKTKLLKNEVVTLEPGVYFPGEWGMRHEDTVVIDS